MNAIEIEQLNFRFSGPAILSDITLTIESGEFLALVGPNGGGKTTLIKLILGLLKPTSGKIKVLGKTPQTASSSIGYVSQYPTFQRDFPITVEDVVELGTVSKKLQLWPFGKKTNSAVTQALEETGIEHLRKETIDTLSGGQIQRVQVARALASKPQILLLDEPTANIDQRGEAEIFDLLKALNDRLTIIVISHDIGFISAYVKRVACLNQTLVCHQPEEIDNEQLEQLYGQPIHMIHHHH